MRHWYGISWVSSLLVAAELVLAGCGSSQLFPSVAQRQVEQELNAVLRRQVGCAETWYNRWFPWLFPAACPVNVKLYTGYIGTPPKPTTGRADSAVFYVAVYDNNKAICGRDSKQLLRFACDAARRLRPVLATTPPVQWIEVEYSSCVSIDAQDVGCSEDCHRRVLLSTTDTLQWRAARVQEQRL